MPRVPRSEEGRITDRPLGAVRPVGAPPAGSFTGGAEGREFQQASRGLAREGADVVLQLQRQADDVAISEFDNVAATGRLDRFNQASKRLGKDALGSTGETMATYEKDLDEYKSTLNNRQLLQAEQLSARHLLQLRGKLEAHEHRQGLVFSRETTKARLQTFQNEMLEDYESETLFQDKVDGATDEFIKLAEREGKSSEWIKAETSQYLSSSYASVVQLMLERGQEIQAKEFYRDREEEVVKDDKALIERMFKTHDGLIKRQEKQRRAEIQDSIEHNIWIKYVDGNLTLAEVDRLGREGRIGDSFHKQMRNEIISPPFDDPGISEEEKQKRQLEIFDLFVGLRGAKVDDKGRIIEPATKNTSAELNKFRQALGASKGFMTRKTYADYVKYTQRNLNEPYEAKRLSLRRLVTIIENLPLPPQMIANSISEAMGLIMDDSVSPQQADEIVDKMGEASVRKANPNKALWPVDAVLTRGVKSFKCIGHNSTGEPLFKRIRK